MSEVGFVSQADQFAQQNEKLIKPRKTPARIYVLNNADILKALSDHTYILLKAPYTEKKAVSLSSGEKQWKDEAPNAADPFVFLPAGRICGKISDIQRYFGPVQQGGVVQIPGEVLQRFFSVIWSKTTLADPSMKAQYDAEVATAKEKRSNDREEAKIKRANAPLSLVTARDIIDPQSVNPDTVLPPRYNAASEDETIAPYFVELIRHKDDKTNVPIFMKPSDEVKERKKRSGRGQTKTLEQYLVELKPGYARNISKLNADGTGSSPEQFNPQAVQSGVKKAYFIALDLPQIGTRYLFVRGTPAMAVQAFNNAMNLLPEPHKSAIRAGLERLTNGNFDQALASIDSSRSAFQVPQ